MWTSTGMPFDDDAGRQVFLGKGVFRLLGVSKIETLTWPDWVAGGDEIAEVSCDLLVGIEFVPFARKGRGLVRRRGVGQFKQIAVGQRREASVSQPLAPLGVPFASSHLLQT